MNKSITIVLVLVVVILGGYFLLQPPQAQAPTEDTVTTGMPVPGTETPEMIVAPEENLIIYSDTGYAPASLALKVGDTIVFKNESEKNMWPASAMHPSHAVYSGTTLSEHCPDLENVAFDACKGIAPGESWSFTFTKAGEWKYHDHLSSDFFGTIVVE